MHGSCSQTWGAAELGNAGIVKRAAPADADLNLFLVFGVQQLLAVRAIVERQRSASDDMPAQDNLCLLYIDTRLERPLEHVRVEHCKYTSMLDYVRGLVGFRSRVRDWLARYRRVYAFIPHAYFYPANYLLFADLDIKRYLIPDGVINYCEYKVDGSKNRTMQARWVVGMLAGLRYRLYEGHITAINSGRYNGVYTFNRQGLITTHPQLIEIELPLGGEIGYQPDSRYALFLDHYLQDVPQELQDRIIAAARRYVDRSAAGTVYLKKHPSWNAPDNAVLGSGKCVVLDSAEPAEWLFENLQPAEVISYASSALATIADTWPGCKCTAIGLNLLLGYPDYREVYKLFASRGINFVDAP